MAILVTHRLEEVTTKNVLLSFSSPLILDSKGVAWRSMIRSQKIRTIESMSSTKLKPRGGHISF